VKVLLDTNIIIDDALEREPFWDASEQVLSLIEQGTIAGYISEDEELLINSYIIFIPARNSRSA
jgi:predicted nucleic acid-binding protein